MNDPISLSQKIYLLGIHPKKGGIISASYSSMNYVLTGAHFLELYMNKNIVFQKSRISVLNDKSSNPLHQFILDKMSKSNRDLKIATWINKFTFSRKHIRSSVQQSLMQQRIIRMEQKRFLFFHWESPLIVNIQALYHLLSEVENSVFKGTSNVEDVLLLTLLKPAGLLKRIFQEREKRKYAQVKLNEMMTNNQSSIAVADALSAAKAVVVSIRAIKAAQAAATAT